MYHSPHHVPGPLKSSLDFPSTRLCLSSRSVKAHTLTGHPSGGPPGSSTQSPCKSQRRDSVISSFACRLVFDIYLAGLRADALIKKLFLTPNPSQRAGASGTKFVMDVLAALNGRVSAFGLEGFDFGWSTEYADQ